MKKVDKLRNSLVMLLAVLLVLAFAWEWNIGAKILVIVTAIALLGTIVFKVVTRK